MTCWRGGYEERPWSTTHHIERGASQFLAALISSTENQTHRTAYDDGLPGRVTQGGILASPWGTLSFLPEHSHRWQSTHLLIKPIKIFLLSFYKNPKAKPLGTLVGLLSLKEEPRTPRFTPPPLQNDQMLGLISLLPILALLVHNTIWFLVFIYALPN